MSELSSPPITLAVLDQPHWASPGSSSDAAITASQTEGKLFKFDICTFLDPF
jgi:hypothetical protein